MKNLKDFAIGFFAVIIYPCVFLLLKEFLFDRATGALIDIVFVFAIAVGPICLLAAMIYFFVIKKGFICLGMLTGFTALTLFVATANYVVEKKDSIGFCKYGWCL